MGNTPFTQSSSHQANIEQLEHTSCTYILNAFAGCLLDDCSTFAWSCKRGISEYAIETYTTPDSGLIYLDCDQIEHLLYVAQLQPHVMKTMPVRGDRGLKIAIFFSKYGPEGTLAYAARSAFIIIVAYVSVLYSHGCWNSTHKHLATRAFPLNVHWFQFFFV